MRADLITIQQTLTSEAATVLNQSISEASRRNHGQTTPLHVASTLLSSSSGFLRQACIKSHPNSSHPLQCRALELCFSVALERLPTSSPQSQSQTQTQEPLLSNALTAALKRAQAHQRRGCPEQQQQQPLLAVKVELEQLIISILDDPSVSRVMREASFSSPAVKSAIEQSLSNNPNSENPNFTGIGFGFRSGLAPVNRNGYLNPRLHGFQRIDEAKRVIEILNRNRKRNPVLVGESEPGFLVNFILGKIENGQISDGPLRDFKVIRFENESVRFGEISGLVEMKIGDLDFGGVVLDLGDLKWLAEIPASGGGGAVAEMKKLLEKFKGRLCLIGTATCETYLRCQVYYPSMENDWDLQAIPIAAKSHLPAIFPRNPNMLNESVSPARSFQIPAVVLPALGGRMSCCSQCLRGYEEEVGNVESSRGNGRSVLPKWLQNAKSDCNKELTKNQKIAELQMKWTDSCSRLHRNQKAPTLKLNSSLDVITPPGSPVGTDLVLGRPNRVRFSPEKAPKSLANGTLDYGKLGDSFDIDLFKKLLKGLGKSVWWQHDAAIAVATAITECKQGNAKSRNVTSKGDIWLMFTGPDKVGKSKMVLALSDLVSGGHPITIGLGSRREDEHSGLNLRGKTALDRFVEAVRRNPFAVIVIEDIDEADVLLRNNVKLAMERGRISDSYGREISLGNVIIILTTNSTLGNDELNLTESVARIDEAKLENLVNKGWQIKLSVCSKTRKRKPNWLYNNDQTKQRKEIGFDLNESAEIGNDKANNKSSSSDVTIDHDQEDNSDLIHKLVALSDDVIPFRPINFDVIKCKTADSLKKRFATNLGDRLEIEDDALERIAAAIWLSKINLEEWIDETMGTSLNSAKARVFSSEDSIVRLELDEDLSDRTSGGYLPSSIRTVVV